MIYVLQRLGFRNGESETETTYILADTPAEAQKSAGEDWTFVGKHNTQDFLQNESKIQKSYKK